jgi:hypothetical protein
VKNQGKNPDQQIGGKENVLRKVWCKGKEEGNEESQEEEEVALL